MEEWEQKEHASECSGWEPGQRWTEPSSWSWNNQDVSDEETFAHLTHESSDGSESNCGPFWAPMLVDSNDIPVATFNLTGDGWGSFCDPQPAPPGLPSTPQSSWQTYTDRNTSGGLDAFRRYVLKRSHELAAKMQVIVEPLEVPSSSEQAPAPMGKTVPDVPPVQHGIVPERITLPRAPSMKSFLAATKTSRPYETALLFGDRGFALTRHLVTSESAKPVFRSAHDQRLSSPKPEHRADNSVPNPSTKHASAY